MTENEGATASSRFPSFFFITTLFSLFRMKGGERGFIQVFLSQNSKL